jgi:hypothetical protein
MKTPATFEKTVRAMSDHQVYMLAIEMTDDDHRASDQTALYVAAYNEAVRRDTVPFPLEG